MGHRRSGSHSRRRARRALSGGRVLAARLQGPRAWTGDDGARATGGSAGEGACDENAVSGACRHDLPFGAAMAEAVAERGRLRQLEDLDLRSVLELENDHPRSPGMACWTFRSLRPPLWFAVISGTHCLPRSRRSKIRAGSAQHARVPAISNEAFVFREPEPRNRYSGHTADRPPVWTVCTIRATGAGQIFFGLPNR